MDSIANFFKEEIIYIFISLFILGITVFVTTRPFMSKKAKLAIPFMFLFLTLALIAHYNLRMEHIKEVREAFEEGKDIMCLDKTNKIGHVMVKKGEWRLKGDTFVNPEFARVYNIRQCIVE